jgi:hypothetical protein
MSDETPPEFPQYQPPQGLPIASAKQSGQLMKAIKSLSKIAVKPKLKAPGTLKRSGLKRSDGVKVKHISSTRWY